MSTWHSTLSYCIEYVIVDTNVKIPFECNALNLATCGLVKLFLRYGNYV